MGSGLPSACSRFGPHVFVQGEIFRARQKSQGRFSSRNTHRSLVIICEEAKNFAFTLAAGLASQHAFPTLEIISNLDVFSIPSCSISYQSNAAIIGLPWFCGGESKDRLSWTAENPYAGDLVLD